jgi:hypothetical protein
LKSKKLEDFTNIQNSLFNSHFPYIQRSFYNGKCKASKEKKLLAMIILNMGHVLNIENITNASNKSKDGKA